MNGQYENVLNIISHYGKANQKHEVLSHTRQNSCYPMRKNKTKAENYTCL